MSPRKRQTRPTSRRQRDATSVGPSRDGHQFHEAWVARSALKLIVPGSSLCAIAVEGLSEEDASGASAEAAEDCQHDFYHGHHPSFERCSRMEVAQFKYSVSNADRPIRIADLRTTLVKFAATDSDLRAKHGATAVSSRLFFALNTNRPISAALLEAFESARASLKPASKDGLAQLEQLRSTLGMDEAELSALMPRVVLNGRLDGLQRLEQANARTIADWSASHDALARARLGDLRQLVRDKAGSEGTHDNLIERVHILAALGVAHETDLLPTPDAFPDVGEVVRRNQLSDFLRDMRLAPRWFIHATGGVGKTVFVQSLAAELRHHCEVVLFDCFGGGAYRTLVDGRHRPERGLLHIVNELACRGLV